VKFSLYSEIQSWPGKSPEQLYGEVLEQIQNADRLGYDAYAVIEHFFFPKFSVSANPLALFAAAAQRTKRINFRTLLHSMPYHNPVVLASEIAVADILLEGRYEFGVGRGHGWMPPKAGLPLTPESRERYEESVELLFEALENERFSYDGKHFQIGDSGIVPRPDRKFRVFLGGTSDRTYELAAERGWAASCRRSAVRSARRAARPLSPGARARNSRTSSGSTPATSTRMPVAAHEAKDLVKSCRERVAADDTTRRPPTS
jgi:alkanesulfonate monooxygenase SsuD/methylene tetrahydromethanopterin reductase-like flavin-dependent oxidoreductase (luciferase family)